MRFSLLEMFSFVPGNKIAMRVRAKRPPWYLSVVAGALYVSGIILK